METEISIGAHSEDGIKLGLLINILNNLVYSHGREAIVTLDETHIPDFLVLKISCQENFSSGAK